MPAPTEAELEEQLAELRTARHQMLLSPLKGTVGDDSYDNTGRLDAINKEVARLEDELRRASQTPSTCVRGRRVV
jgi:hypothetical protein